MTFEITKSGEYYTQVDTCKPGHGWQLFRYSYKLEGGSSAAEVATVADDLITFNPQVCAIIPV
jgi:hypothetical protein